MLRSISWRRVCPDIVSARIDEALEARFYILHQTGPTAFVLKGEQSSKKIKVCLGDPNLCSCSVFKKSNELCHHILWILLKKFRVPRINPLIWQQALVEREINEIILGYLRQQPANQSDASNQPHDRTQAVEQREIGLDDVCPICQDSLLDSSQSLVYCRYGCGQSIHTKCMKIMADHQRSVGGKKPIQCPLCREEFGPIKPELSKTAKRLRAEKESFHLGVTCSHCHVCPIAGRCYRCTTCVSYHLCHICFSSDQIHVLHSFQSRKHSNQPWRPAVRSSTLPPSDPHTLPPGVVSSLQSRSLTESDYELLLQLDHPLSSQAHSPRGRSESSPSHRTNGHVTGVPARVINTLHVEPLDGSHPLIVEGASCQLCHEEYTRGDWVRKLPCRHKFHRHCLQEWLSTNSVCPIDGHTVCSQTAKRRRRLASRTRNSARQHGIIPLTRALTENPVRGQSSGFRGHQTEQNERRTFTVSGQQISSSAGSSSGRRLFQRHIQDSLPLPRVHPLSAGTTLPYITAPSLMNQTEEQLLSRCKQQLCVSIPSGTSSIPANTRLSLAPTVTRCTQRVPQASLVDHMMSHDQPQHGGVLQEWISHDQPQHGGVLQECDSPVGVSRVKPCVYEEVRTISLPSLRGLCVRTGGLGEGRIMKGSLAHKRKSTAPVSQDNSKSLQVSSFKCRPLPLTNTLMTTSAGL